ncbi:MAG TPA: hypothetical protein VME67_07770 [Mycobacterium sp.]|nr:hypothetical protein [Mycobacterium sp.]HTX94743.1 hypothetical protein [Mycobacterium sp.]
MFTLLVSWLLVACVPGLLMLAALSLGRLEKEFAQKSVTANRVDEFLEYAGVVDVRLLAREGMPEALEYFHRRQAWRLSDSALGRLEAGPHHALPPFALDLTGRGEMTLPTRIHTHSRINPQFKATRHVDPV